MPEHTSFLTLLLAHAKETLAHNAGYLGHSFVNGTPPNWQSTEPIISAFCVVVMLLVVAFLGRARLRRLDDAVVPEARLDEVIDGYLRDVLSCAPSALAVAKRLMREVQGRRPDEVIGLTTATRGQVSSPRRGREPNVRACIVCSC